MKISKACPFCESRDVYCKYKEERGGFNAEPPEYYVRCCDCGARGPKRDSEDKAIMAWNNMAVVKMGRDLPEISQCRSCGCLFAFVVTLFSDNIKPMPLHQVYCPQCHARGSREHTEEDAIKLWNEGK